MKESPTLLFCIRSQVDLDRYLAFAGHLRGKAKLVWADFSQIADLTLTDNSQQHSTFELEKTFGLRNQSPEELKNWIQRLDPDVIVLDQFGPSASEQYKGLPKLARELNVVSCMIPHGIPTISAAPFSGPKVPDHVADIVFFANEFHRNHASSFYGVHGTFTKIMGDPRFDIDNMLEPNGSRESAPRSNPDKVRIGYFESNVPEYLCVDANDLQFKFRDSITRFQKSTLRIRSHPRFREPKENISSSQLIQWADVISSISSSAIFEGLYADKSAYVLNVTSFSNGKCQTLFDMFPNEIMPDVGPLPILKIRPDRQAYQEACWGGLTSGKVAKQYAEILIEISQSDMSNLEQF